jgi:putative tryptophan/tyrosine transport system substrate-binding protein
MRRRDLLIWLVGLSSAWPAALQGPNAGLRRVGVLMPITPDNPTGLDREAVFRQALQERGWIEGQNLKIDIRWAVVGSELVQKYAAELVASSPDVILAGGGGVVADLLKATRTVPIVFTETIDPVALGYVASLARPGGNATGFMNIQYGFSAKYLELLKQIAPGVTRVAVLRAPGLSRQLAAIGAVAPSLDMDVSSIELSDADEIERAIAAFSAAPNGGLVVVPSTRATTYSHWIVTLAAKYKLPAVYPNRFHVVDGGLISYGPALLDQYLRAADYVDCILRGTKPANLPVQAPRRYETALNLKTARDLGLAVPRLLLARVDEIIE